MTAMAGRPPMRNDSAGSAGNGARLPIRTLPAAGCLLVMLLAVVASGCGGHHDSLQYRCPMHPEVVADRPGDCPVCGMRLVAVEPTVAPHAQTPAAGALYVCPMHPNVTSATPGTCPLCGMALVQREVAAEASTRATAPQGRAEVTVPAAKRELIGMTIGEVAMRPLVRRIRAAATIAADESRLYRVAAPAEGFVDQVFVRGPGDPVRTGQPLIKLYNLDALNILRRDLYNLAQNADPQADKNLDLQWRRRNDPAWQPYELLLQRIRRWGLSDEQIKTLLETPENLTDLLVYSITAGEVAEKSVIPGQIVAEGEQLFLIADLSRVWAVVDLAESDGPLVRVGSPVELEAPALPGRRFSGRLTALTPFLDPQARTQRARIELDNPGQILRPGLPVVALLTVDLGARLVVPASAVLRTGDTAYTFRVGDGDRLEPIAVRTGLSDGDFVEILDGLAVNDRVVTSATFLIDSESAMAAAFQAVQER